MAGGAGVGCAATVGIGFINSLKVPEEVGTQDSRRRCSQR
jgi:hypothetical protein